jgi:CheY-like chemotaxis protein
MGNVKKRALIVDNNKRALKTVKAILEYQGYDISCVSSLRLAEEASILFRILKPELIAISADIAGLDNDSVLNLLGCLECTFLVYGQNIYVLKRPKTKNAQQLIYNN